MTLNRKAKPGHKLVLCFTLRTGAILFAGRIGDEFALVGIKDGNIRNAIYWDDTESMHKWIEAFKGKHQELWFKLLSLRMGVRQVRIIQ